MLTRRSLLAATPGLAIAGAAYAQEASVEPPEVMLALDAWTDTYGRPNARVKLNGAGPFGLMVDTGSTGTVITQRIATLLAAPIVGIAHVNGMTGTADMPLARLSLLETGVVTKHDFNVAVLPDLGLRGIDGILGADVFAGRKLSFDIQAKEVKVEAPRKIDSPRRRASRNNIRLRNGVLAELDGVVGDIPARLMLDTGAQHCIVNLPLKAIIELRYPNIHRVNRVRVVGVTGASVRGDYFELPDVQFTEFRVNKASAVAADAAIFQTWGLDQEPAMIVGASLLSRLARFSIDYGALQFEGEVLAERIAEGALAMG